MLTIDKRLLQAKGEMNITENFNRVLALLDAAVKTIADLSEQVAALEPDNSSDDTPADSETPSETTPEAPIPQEGT